MHPVCRCSRHALGTESSRAARRRRPSSPGTEQSGLIDRAQRSGCGRGSRPSLRAGWWHRCTWIIRATRAACATSTVSAAHAAALRRPAVVSASAASASMSAVSSRRMMSSSSLPRLSAPAPRRSSHAWSLQPSSGVDGRPGGARVGTALGVSAMPPARKNPHCQWGLAEVPWRLAIGVPRLPCCHGPSEPPFNIEPLSNRRTFATFAPTVNLLDLLRLPMAVATRIARRRPSPSSIDPRISRSATLHVDCQGRWREPLWLSDTNLRRCRWADRQLC